MHTESILWKYLWATELGIFILVKDGLYLSLRYAQQQNYFG